MDTDAPALLGLSHLALSTTDVDAAADFFVSVLGFEQTTRNELLAFVIHREGRIGIGLVGHLGEVRGPFDHRRVGLDHLALAVRDAATLQAWEARLTQFGVEHSPIVDSGGGLHLNLRAPGDLPIELYVMDESTAAAFGLRGTDEAFAVGPA